MALNKCSIDGGVDALARDTDQVSHPPHGNRLTAGPRNVAASALARLPALHKGSKNLNQSGRQTTGIRVV
jgi:hypothetical protein